MKKIFFVILILVCQNSFSQTNDTIVQTTKTISTDEIVFTKTEIEASFPGGNDAWLKFLQKNLKANVPAKNGAPPGKYQAEVVFIVDTKGDISDIKIVNNYAEDYGCGDEAARVIKKSKKWIPAMQNGQKVKSMKRQKITFLVGEG